MRSLDERAEKSAGDSVPPAADVDSIDAGALDHFRYVAAPRTAYASRMPSNYRPIARSLARPVGATGSYRAACDPPRR